MILEDARKSADTVTRSPSLPPPRRRNTIGSIASIGRRPVCDHLEMPDVVQLGSRHLPSSKGSLGSEAAGAALTFESDIDAGTTDIAPSPTVLDTPVPHISTTGDQPQSREQGSLRYSPKSGDGTTRASKPDPSTQSSGSASHVDYDRHLLATQGIVKMGKGYSYIADPGTNSSPSFYQIHHSSTEYIVGSDHREQRHLSSVQDARGAILPKNRNHIETQPTPAFEHHKTLSVRVKNAFFRVVSSPVLSKPPTAGIASCAS